jgi:hypothetical protein
MYLFNEVVKTCDTSVSYLDISCVTCVTADVTGSNSPACRQESPTLWRDRNVTKKSLIRQRKTTTR